MDQTTVLWHGTLTIPDVYQVKKLIVEALTKHAYKVVMERGHETQIYCACRLQPPGIMGGVINNGTLGQIFISDSSGQITIQTRLQKLPNVATRVFPYFEITPNSIRIEYMYETKFFTRVRFLFT